VACRNKHTWNHAIKTISPLQILVGDLDWDSRILKICFHQVGKRNIACSKNLYVFVHVATSLGTTTITFYRTVPSIGGCGNVQIKSNRI
jgi:hypothetical protein